MVPSSAKDHLTKISIPGTRRPILNCRPELSYSFPKYRANCYCLWLLPPELEGKSVAEEALQRQDPEALEVELT